MAEPDYVPMSPVVQKRSVTVSQASSRVNEKYDVEFTFVVVHGNVCSVASSFRDVGSREPPNGETEPFEEVDPGYSYIDPSKGSSLAEIDSLATGR